MYLIRSHQSIYFWLKRAFSSQSCALCEEVSKKYRGIKYKFDPITYFLKLPTLRMKTLRERVEGEFYSQKMRENKTANKEGKGHYSSTSPS